MASVITEDAVITDMAIWKATAVAHTKLRHSEQPPKIHQRAANTAHTIDAVATRSA